jgi:FkbM family methyltransferase
VSAVSLVRLSDDFGCYAPTDPDGQFLELRFVYTEIFGETYAEDIARVPAAGVVLDIGANVGMFTLKLKAHSPQATVLAFEPMPDTLEALRLNIELHELTGVTVYPLALGAEDATAEFTFYPQAPANSTRYPERKDYGTPLLDTSTTVQIEVTTAATVLARHPALTVIDLVKIDVEGAEAEVLAGLAEADWARVRAFVLEVDDVDGRLDDILNLLACKGFTVTANHAPLIPEEHGLYIVHAHRPA